MNVKSFYTAKELAEMSLTSLPSFHANVRKRAEKENWLSRPRQGRGGGVEYAFDGLPKSVQLEIKARQTAELMKATTPKTVAVVKSDRELGSLTDKDRLRVDNRLLLCLLVEQYAEELGTQDKALDLVSQLSKDNALPIQNGLDYNEVCANAKASRAGGVGIGKRKLHEWLIEHKKASTSTQRLFHLAPAKQGRPVIEWQTIAWVKEFLKIYRNPNGLSVTTAYRIFATQYGKKVGKDNVPTLAQVKLALDKVPVLERERGRQTGSVLKQLVPYVKRDWNADWFKNNDVWVGDGHSLKMQVKHPYAKTAVTPELTVIMDAPSRYIVGWSLSHSESGFAVLDALAMGWKIYGFNAVYYSDNGSGETNKMLDADVTGILPRMGVTHATGIPGNPQGRGIIERFMQGVPKLIAQAFDSYTGRHGDKETVRKRLSAIASYNSALTKKKGEFELSEKQKVGKLLLPTWEALYAACQVAIDWYNHEHTHSAIGMTPAQKRAELFAIHQNIPAMPTEYELIDMVRPAETRTMDRGVVDFRNGEYFCREMGGMEKQKVVVCYDQHDTSYLIIKDNDGRYLGRAILNGHKVDAFPKSFIEQARQNSDKARKKNLQNQIDKIDFEANRQKVIDIQNEMAEHFDYALLDLQDDNDGDLVLYEEIDFDAPLARAM